MLKKKKPKPDVVPAPLTETTFSLGRLEPAGEIISLAAPSGAGEARIAQLNISEGDSVKKGDTLAILDNQPSLQAALEIAQSNLVQTQAALARTRLEVATTSAQLTAALRAAEASLAQAETKASRYRELSATAVAREEKENVFLELETARAELAEATARLDRYRPDENNQPVDITLAQSEVEAARASLLQAEANLTDSRVTAPADGAILQIRARPGERIGQDPILEMGDTAHMMARVEVYESEVPNLRPGQTTTLTASTLPEPLHGTIERIANYVQKQTIVNASPAANTDARIVEVWVSLDPASSEKAARFVNLQVRVAFEK